jgi:hypothetical protein
LGDQIKEYEMGWACGMYGGKGCMQGLGREAQGKETTWNN